MRLPNFTGICIRSPASSATAANGLSLEFRDWRFNLRKSKTGPVLRLNLETRQTPALLREKTAEFLKLLD